MNNPTTIQYQIKAIKERIKAGKCKNQYAAQGKVKQLENRLIIINRCRAYSDFLAR